MNKLICIVLIFSNLSQTSLASDDISCDEILNSADQVFDVSMQDLDSGSELSLQADLAYKKGHLKVSCLLAEAAYISYSQGLDSSVKAVSYFNEAQQCCSGEASIYANEMKIISKRLGEKIYKSKGTISIFIELSCG